jgi:hypothetical protein
MEQCPCDVVCYLWVFWVLPGNPLSSPKSSQELRVCGDYRPFLRRYWVAGGDGIIAPGEFLKSRYLFLTVLLKDGAQRAIAIEGATAQERRL